MSSRLFAVLDCFTTDRTALTLTEIAGATELPLSTARRLIQELVAWGGLERMSEGRYRVGMRLWEVGSCAVQQRDLRDAALPYMQDLYVATRENVQLLVREGQQALCIEKIYGSYAVPTEIDVGGRLPLHGTGGGKALLAFSPREVVMETIHGGLDRCTPHTLVEPGRLMGALQKVRASGLAYSLEEKLLGTVAVASPILRADGELVAAVAIVGRVGIRLDRLGPAVRTAALGISRSIR